MRALAISIAVLLAGAVPTLALDAESQAVVDRSKIGKPVSIQDIAVLMMGSERWCYNVREGNCGWSDIYLSTSAKGAIYEISNPWSETVDISFVDEGVFKDDRFICETGHDWIASVRAYERDGGNAIEGRALEALKQDMRDQLDLASNADCFDYIFEGVDASADTVSLKQRQYVDGVTDPANDAAVTLYFNKDAAAELGWYW